MADDAPIHLRGQEVVDETTLRNLLLGQDPRSLQEAQKRIDDHIRRQSLAIQNDTWPISRPMPDYQKEPSYPVREALPQWWEFDLGGYSEQVTVARRVLPTRRNYPDEPREPSSGQAERWGEIEYDLVARFSAKGTRWALAAFCWDNFAGQLYRAEIVQTFYSLQHASSWLAAERGKVMSPEIPSILPDEVREIVSELQRASNGKKSKSVETDRGIVVDLRERTHSLGIER
jgi:hypothetical protein